MRGRSTRIRRPGLISNSATCANVLIESCREGKSTKCRHSSCPRARKLWVKGVTTLPSREKKRSFLRVLAFLRVWCNKNWNRKNQLPSPLTSTSSTSHLHYNSSNQPKSLPTNNNSCSSSRPLSSSRLVWYNSNSSNNSSRRASGGASLMRRGVGVLLLRCKISSTNNTSFLWTIMAYLQVRKFKYLRI